MARDFSHNTQAGGEGRSAAREVIQEVEEGLAASPVAQAASTPISRRELFTALPGAAVGAAALAAVAGGVAVTASGCSGDSGSATNPEVLQVSVDDVTTLDGYTEAENPEKLYTVTDFTELPEGTQLFSNGSKVAAALCVGKTSRPLSTVSLLNLSDGRFVEALEQGKGHEEGFNIHEVRCSDKLLVWVESNYLTDEWRVYNASLDASDMSIGEPTLLDEGDGGYDVPEIAVVESQAYWIVQPAEGGEHASEDSLLKTNGGVAYTSHGRFNGGLYTSGNAVVCMPRAESKSSVYYQLTAVQNGTVAATQVLPHGFRPSTFTYLDGFSFGIGAGYDYGDGIADVGTYLPAGSGKWLRIARTPVTPAGKCNGWLFCKSSGRTVFVDVKGERYFVVGAPSGAEDYGDYSIATGDCGDVVFVYAAVSETAEGETKRKVVVRTIKPKSIG